MPLLRGRRAAATVGPAATPQPIHQTPDMDAAVIELDDAGRPAAMADVQLSPEYPHGVTVPPDQHMLATGQIRYRWWDDDEWDANGGKGTRDVLSASARQFYLKTLGDQGHNEMLSITNWCGRPYPATGIPQTTPQRWIDPTDGTMTVGSLYYGQAVRRRRRGHHGAQDRLGGHHRQRRRHRALPAGQGEAELHRRRAALSLIRFTVTAFPDILARREWGKP